MSIKIDPTVLAKLGSTYGVGTPTPSQILSVKAVAGDAPDYESILNDAGYQYNEEERAYVLGLEKIYYIASQDLFVWTLADALGRGIQGIDKLTKWVKGDKKYPNGKANQFIATYSEMTGQKLPEKPQIKSSEPVAPIFGEYDKDLEIIHNIKKKLKGGFRLPGDELIDLYNKAKELKSNRLMNFIKSLKPLGENIIKESMLASLIRVIIKEMINEYGKDDAEVISIASHVWGNQHFRVKDQQESEYGIVYSLSRKNVRGYDKTFYIWKTLDGQWKTLDNKTRKWKDVDMINPSENVEEETGTGAVAGYSTPLAFSKRNAMEENNNNYIKIATNIAKKVWKDHFKNIEFRPSISDAGMLMFRVNTGGTFYRWICKNSRDAWFYGDYHGTRIAWKQIEHPEAITEESTTGDVAGYNIPAAFSKAGGSKRGLEGSEALGYTLTPEGEKQMRRHADKLYETKTKTKTCSQCNMMAVNGVWTHEQGCPNSK